MEHLASNTSALPRLPKGLRRQALRHLSDPYRDFSTDDLLAVLAAARLTEEQRHYPRPPRPDRGSGRDESRVLEPDEGSRHWHTPRRRIAPPGSTRRRTLLVLTVLSVFSFATLESLVVKADAAKTARNIADHELLFRISACSFVIVAVLDVVVAWALYAVLRPVNRSIALLAAWLRVAYVAVFAAAVSNLFAAVRLLTDGNSRDAFGPRQLNAQVMTSVNVFQDGWNAALVIFGLRLLVLGYLVFQSSYIPRVLGILLGIASLGYRSIASAGSYRRATPPTSA